MKSEKNQWGLNMSDRCYTYQRDNCDFSTDNEEDFPTLSEVPSLGERLDSGSVVPDGGCPECGAFVYATRVSTCCGVDPKLMDVTQSLLNACVQALKLLGTDDEAAQGCGDPTEVAQDLRDAIAKATEGGYIHI